MDFKNIIETNNENNTVDLEELSELIDKSKLVFEENHSKDVWFERSVFINWTCGIADCKYCYLSTKPKKDMKALRSKESILAEILLCKALGYKIGYITGGLRVEPTEYLIDLLNKCETVAGHKLKMNFGPYSEKEILQFKPHISGIGSAVESFDEELHNFICPSKPLKSLMRMLDICKREDIPTFITIILGMGEKKEDIEIVIEKIKKYDIQMVQLCFLKPQENTVFEKVPTPNTDYMAWWIAKLRIACPKIILKIALVEERMHELSKLLDAGANCFSRFMIFKEFNTKFSKAIESECKKANRKLVGEWNSAENLNANKIMSESTLPEEIKTKVKNKLDIYIQKLNK